MALPYGNAKGEHPAFSTYNPQTFTGREAETIDLAARLRGSCRVLAITGMTGIGKTALTERVVAQLMDDGATLPYYRLSLDILSLTPDFSSSGAALLRALGEEPTLADQQNPRNLLAHVLQRLCRQPCRVQIDSLERLLRGNEQDGWSEFCDPLWLEFLVQFLAGSECPSQLLLTSQDIPADLDIAASRYPEFWHCQTLRGLTMAEQRLLFLKLGLPQDAAALKILGQMGAFYDGHPLVLQVLADEIRQPPFQGNVTRYWQHHQSEFLPSSPPSPPALSSPSPLTRSRLFRRRVRLRVEQTVQRLPDAARRMLCASAVFRRPVPVGFWQAMVAADHAQVAWEALHDRHLVEFAPDRDDIALVRQHNLIRAVAYDLLKADGPTWHAAERQAAHLWLTAYEPAPNKTNLEVVRGYLEAFDHYHEIGDWKTAKSVFFVHPGKPSESQWYDQLDTWGLYKEQVIFFEKWLNFARTENDCQLEYIPLSRLGRAHKYLGHFLQAANYHQRHLEIARRFDSRREESRALCGLGLVSYRTGKYKEAIDYHQQCLMISREIGSRQAEGIALGNLGLVYDCLNESEQAIGYLQQCLSIACEVKDRISECNTLCGLGIAYNNLGKYQQAISHYQRCFFIANELGDRRRKGTALSCLAGTHIKLGNYAEAMENYCAGLLIFQEIGYVQGEAEALKDLAELHQALGEVAVAQQYCQQALGLATELGIPLAAECEALQQKMAAVQGE